MLASDPSATRIAVRFADFETESEHRSEADIFCAEPFAFFYCLFQTLCDRVGVLFGHIQLLKSIQCSGSLYPHKVEIGAANMRSPNGTVFSES